MTRQTATVGWENCAFMGTVPSNKVLLLKENTEYVRDED